MLFLLIDPAEEYTKMKSKYRFVFLSVIVFLEFGRYFCQELPSALEDPIIKVIFSLRKHYKTDEQAYGIFQALYNIPNLISPFLTGYILDRFGRPYFCVFI